MAISYSDYKKKYGANIDYVRRYNNVVKQYNQNSKEAKKEYENIASKRQLQTDELIKKYDNQGIVTQKNGVLPTVESVVLNRVNNKDYNIQNQLDRISTGKSLAVESAKEEKENINKFNAANQQKDIAKLREELENTYYKEGQAYYNYLNKKLDEDDIGFYDKTLGRVVAPVISPFTSKKYILKNENGDTYSMPTYEDLKHQKVLDSYGDGFWGTVGKIGSSALYEGGKLATSAALNALIPGTGTATYFGNIYFNQWNNAVAEGYSKEQALAYATLSTATEAVTSKILGGTTNAIFGTGTSELSQSIANGLSKFIKSNPTLVNGISNAISEGGEEFIQEYVDVLTRNLTLGENNALLTKENFENALFSAAVGSLTGGISGTFSRNTNVNHNIQNNQNTKTENSNRYSLPTYNQNTENTIINDAVNSQGEQNMLQNNVGNVTIKSNQNNIINTYQNINDAIYDYVNIIKDDFRTNINIQINKSNVPVDYSTQSQTTIFNKAKESFSKIGKKVFKNNNDDIVVTNEDIKESVAKTVRNTKQKKLITEHIEVFSKLDKIIENGTKIASSTENKNRVKYKNWDYYATPVTIDGKNCIIEFDTVLRQDGEKHFRLERIYSLDEVIQKQVVPTGLLNENQSASRFVEQPVSYNNNSTNSSQSQIEPLPLNNMHNNQNNILNPLEISQLTQDDANTTPMLPNVNRNRVNDGDSRFASNIQNKTNMLNENQKNTILSEEEVRYYDKVTNEESLNEAFSRLNEGGEAETRNWFYRHTRDENGKMKSNVSSVDIAEGYILLKQYADSGDYDSMVSVAKTMRNMGTEAGQAVQAFNIMARLTPEGMVKYAQSELSEAYDRMVKNKTKKWINQHQKDFDLTPQETGAIMDIMKKVSTMEDGYNKRVELAKIQKIMTDKLPPERGAGIKSWMRISMLFNPKTQIRNVAGNAIIAPVNYFSDLFASMADKVIGAKTGYRTIGVTNIQNYVKGFKEGAYQSYNDFKLGINTRNIQGNRFEIGEGKSFNNNTAIGKALNRVDSLLSFMLDAGDRMFYEATFTNSINNQLILNNTTEVTQDMIDIATQEALSRTWQDNNNYTRFVLNIRKGLNAIHIPGKEGYGLGDVLIPFAKTPANLTKAIVDYSPAGLVNTLLKGTRLKNAIKTGQFTPQMQHDFVQSLGKATVGTMLYVAGYALAKAGIVSGESDDDKDVQNFMRNTLGVNSYSIKIGDKAFAYDWSQPIAAPFSMMANFVKKQEENENLAEAITSALDTGLNVIFEQSFLTSINDVLSEPGEIGTKLGEQLLDLPARAVPTFMKQIADMVDGTQRTSFEYGKPLESAINSFKSKIPFLSKTLAPSVDSMGREIQKYGGNNNIFNVFFNPANVSTENISESAGEIYRLYQETGDTTIMPRVAPYYINKDGEKITMNSSQRAEYQKISGNIIEENVENLLDNSDYEKLNDEDKSTIIKSIVDYSYNKAREEVLGLEMPTTYNKVNKYTEQGGSVADYYMNKDEINYSIDNPEKYATITQITDYNDYLDYKDKIDEIRNNADDKKTATINYINSLKLSIPQKAMFIKIYYSSFNNYNAEIVNYINKNVSSVEEKADILKHLGFTIKDGRVYW